MARRVGPTLLVCAVLLLAAGLQAQNPVPSVFGLSPSSVAAGSSGFSLSVLGWNFVSGCTVRWNGADRPTSYGGLSQVNATISAADVATAGTAVVTVFNPAPGGGLSSPVTFTITPGATPAVLAVSPSSFEFTAAGGVNPASKQLSITNQGGGTFNWAATVSYRSGFGWLWVDPWTAWAPTSATVRIDAVAALLSAGTYEADIRIFAFGDVSNSPQYIPVKLTVTALPQLSVLPQFLTLEAVEGTGTAISRPISISNDGPGTLSWTATASTTNGGGWLSLSPAQGTTPATPSIVANPAGLAPGIYIGSVSIKEVASQKSETISVALHIARSAGAILLSQSDFVFNVTQGSTAVERQEFRVLNAGQGTINWKLEHVLTGTWLLLDATSGTSGADPLTATPVGITVNPSGLAAGTYYALLVASAPEAINSPQLATVHLRVTPATSPPLASASPSGFLFVVEEGRTAAPQRFRLRNIGGGNLLVNLSTSVAGSGSWLSVSHVTAVAPADVTVQVSPAGLGIGAYRGSIVLGWGSAGESQALSVLLLVVPVGTPITSLAAGPQAACVPSELYALSTLIPNNFQAPTSYPLPITVKVLDNCGASVTKAMVIASFAGVIAPPQMLADIGGGVYTGVWVAPGEKRVRISIRALKPPLKEGNVEVVGDLTASGFALPLLYSGGVVNGASFAARAPVAPGSIISLFGERLAEQERLSAAPLPRELDGVCVKVGGQDVPLFYVGPGQINAQLPFDLASNTNTSVVVTSRGRLSPVQTLLVAAAQPGIFAYTLGGVVRGAVLDESYRTVGPANPAERGKVIQIFATGLGPTDPAVATGEPGPSSPLARLVPATRLTVTIGGIEAGVQFAGLAPGFTGLYQVNAVVPHGVAAGDVPLVLTVDGTPSNQVLLAIK